jgi:hypothetical protein
VSEIKLNEWRFGEVPELHPEAVVAVGGTCDVPQETPVITAVRCLCNRHQERWYAILSTEPPKMPEPELRLPEGWEVELDNESEDEHGKDKCFLRVVKDGEVWLLLSAEANDRNDCVTAINRLLEGK